MYKKNNYIKCIKCGWVYFSISMEIALKEVHEFNAYFNSLSEEQQNKFYGGVGSSIENYENCYRCGNSHENFVNIKNENEVPFGSSINPLLDPCCKKNMN